MYILNLMEIYAYINIFSVYVGNQLFSMPRVLIDPKKPIFVFKIHFRKLTECNLLDKPLFNIMKMILD